jgi:hypothetical protein
MNDPKDTRLHEEQDEMMDEEELRAEQIERESNVDVVDTRLPEETQPRSTGTSRPVESARTTTSASEQTENYAPLFEDKRAEEFRNQWLEIQSRFVDDPSVAVKEADELVSQIIQNVTRMFANERTSLENQWNSGDKISTEELRVALRRYRSFFNRLLTLEV